jgi:hypothetical protein
MAWCKKAAKDDVERRETGKGFAEGTNTKTRGGANDYCAS